MQHVQGYTGNHWTPPSGNYSLRIAPAAAKATTKTTMHNVPTLLTLLMAVAVQRNYTVHIAQ
jgi:hypothetical protein